MLRGLWEGTNATTQTHVTIIPGSTIKQFVTHTAHLLTSLFSVMIFSAQMIWKCNASKVVCKKISKVLTNKPGALYQKGNELWWAHPTCYPWYKEKFPTLKDTDLHKLHRKERYCFIFYQLQTLVINRSIKQVWAKILQALYCNPWILIEGLNGGGGGGGLVHLSVVG